MKVGFNDDWRAQVDALDALNCNAQILRVPCEWRAANPAPGVWDWTHVDRAMEYVYAAGLRPMFAPSFAPEYARDRTTDQAWPTQEMNGAWQLCCAALAARYPSVAAIEAWNEPNISVYGSVSGQGPRVPPHRAGELAALARDILPDNVPVITGGIVCGVEGWEKYLKVLLRQLGDRTGVHVGIHPYGRGDNKVTKTLDFVRAAQRRAGNRTIWATEFGAAVSDCHDSQEIQANALVQEINGMEKLGVGAAILHRLRDPEPTWFPWENTAGIVSLDGGAKRAYGDVQTAFKAVA